MRLSVRPRIAACHCWQAASATSQISRPGIPFSHKYARARRIKKQRKTCRIGILPSVVGRFGTEPAETAKPLAQNGFLVTNCADTAIIWAMKMRRNRRPRYARHGTFGRTDSASRCTAGQAAHDRDGEGARRVAVENDSDACFRWLVG